MSLKNSKKTKFVLIGLLFVTLLLLGVYFVDIKTDNEVVTDDHVSMVDTEIEEKEIVFSANVRGTIKSMSQTESGYSIILNNPVFLKDGSSKQTHTVNMTDNVIFYTSSGEINVGMGAERFFNYFTQTDAFRSDTIFFLEVDESNLVHGISS